MAGESHAVLMDRNYRLQRHIYDLTRRHYLLGRDFLIDKLQPPVGGSVLEMGSGTAANIIAAAEKYPEARFYGVDISSMMLATARSSLTKHGLSGRVRLQLADATKLDGRAFFGIDSFDRVFFSYSLSMIPDWRGALRAAFSHVRPGGSLHVVDFGAMNDLPGFAKAGLRLWLRHFSVTPRDELRDELQAIARDQSATLVFSSVWRSYAAYAELKRPRAT